MSAEEVIEAHRCRERGMVCDEGELWCDTCKAVVNESDVSVHQLAQLQAAGYAVVELPQHLPSAGVSADGDLVRDQSWSSVRRDYPGSARHRAAALLAAADAAEVSVVE